MVDKLNITFFDTGENTNSINTLAGAIVLKLYSYCDIHFIKHFDELKYKITNPDSTTIIAFSFTTMGFKKFQKEIIGLSKLKNDKVILIAGGVHPSAKPLEVLNSGIDYVCMGEGEKFICQFITNLLDNTSVKSIKGVGYFDNGHFKSNGLSERIELDEYPPFCETLKRFNPIEITRGCIYGCSFCQTPFMFKARFRHRSVENICHYVAILKKHKLTDIRFITPSALSYGSENENPKLEKIEELLSNVRKTLGKEGRIFFGTFPSEVRPEHVTPDALKILKKYVANNNLVIGGQSGSDRILKKCHRGHTVESIFGAVKYCKESGFIPNVDFIFGFPEETEEDELDSLKLIEKLVSLGARIHAHYFLPLPGSPWGNKKPTRLSEKTVKMIEKLISFGALYGQWKQQESFVKNHITSVR